MQTDVEVELHEILNFGQTYEYFVDLLRDKVIEAVEGGNDPGDLDLDDPDYGTTIYTTDYAMTSVPHPNVVMFSVSWEVDR